MDTFAHGFWSFAVFHRKKYALLAILFGILPDILSFGILFIATFVNGTLRIGPTPPSSFPNWLNAAYNTTHSLIIFMAIFILIYLITKKWFWPLTSWALHIIIDIPTHSFRFFPTPFLWPISDYKFDGISWATPWFLLVNYGALMVVFLAIAHNKAKKKGASFKKHQEIPTSWKT